MFLIKKPDYVSKKKSLIIYNKALSKKLITELTDYINKCLDEDIYSYTNIDTWNPSIKGDSEEIKVISLGVENQKLYRSVCKELEINYNLITNGMAWNIHVMKKGCYINEHTDGHVEYAISIYLNTLEKEDGGIFQFEDIDELSDKNVFKGIIPELNKMVIIKNTIHRVSEILKPKYRIVLQGFYSEKFFYKGESINRLFHKENSASFVFN